MLRDVIFEAAASADLGPKKEESHLLPGTIAKPVTSPSGDGRMEETRQ